MHESAKNCVSHRKDGVGKSKISTLDLLLDLGNIIQIEEVDDIIILFPNVKLNVHVNCEWNHLPPKSGNMGYGMLSLELFSLT